MRSHSHFMEIIHFSKYIPHTPHTYLIIFLSIVCHIFTFAHSCVSLSVGLLFFTHNIFTCAYIISMIHLSTFHYLSSQHLYIFPSQHFHIYLLPCCVYICYHQYIRHIVYLNSQHTPDYFSVYLLQHFTSTYSCTLFLSAYLQFFTHNMFTCLFPFFNTLLFDCVHFLVSALSHLSIFLSTPFSYFQYISQKSEHFYVYSFPLSDLYTTLYCQLTLYYFFVCTFFLFIFLHYPICSFHYHTV